MNPEPFLSQRLLCIAVVDNADDAVPLAEALLAGGLKVMEVTFRTAGAAESIRRIRHSVPHMAIGAGTLLTADNVKQAVDAGAQFGVSPGLSDQVSAAAQTGRLPLFPGVVTPSEIMRAMDLGWRHLKFFPSETFGGVNALKALAGPFGHTGIKFIPTGGITMATPSVLSGLVAGGGGGRIVDGRAKTGDEKIVGKNHVTGGRGNQNSRSGEVRRGAPTSFTPAFRARRTRFRGRAKIQYRLRRIPSTERLPCHP